MRRRQRYLYRRPRARNYLRGNAPKRWQKNDEGGAAAPPDGAARKLSASAASASKGAIAIDIFGSLWLPPDRRRAPG